MAQVITIGTVKLVASTSTGTIESLAGTTITYTDASLPTRAVNLALGEYVIFLYNTVTLTTDGITPLTDIYSQGLTDANADNELIGADIKRQLQINNACAAKKGSDYIEGCKKGNADKKLINDAEIMVALIDSIVGFIPENEIIEGNQATYMIQVRAGVGVKAITLTFGSATYSFNSSAATDATLAADIALNINNLYPQNYSYYAEASGENVIISGSDFDSDNATLVTGSTTNGTLYFYSPSVLANGTTQVLQGANGITNLQCQKILNKINKLCSTPCENVVDFTNP